jgi:outer membrane protein OmpA-like peptidoglycan-associated protein
MQKLSINIERTKAILIGIGNYKHLPVVKPAAINNVTDFRSLLTDPMVLGLPESHIVSFLDLRNDDLYNEIEAFINHEEQLDTEALIFYYVGHGIRSANTKQLYLTGINTKKSSVNSSGILYSDIISLIENSQVQKRIIIIDACHSGLATLGEDSYFEKELDIKGSYTLTSASWDEKAFFDPNHRNTTFTANILDALKNHFGLAERYISLESLFNYLVKSPASKSTPQRKSNLNNNDLILFKNVRFDLKKAELKADALFDENKFKEALAIYIQISDELPGLKNKIDECKRLIHETKDKGRGKWTKYSVVSIMVLLLTSLGYYYYVRSREHVKVPIVISPTSQILFRNITFEPDGSTINKSCRGMLDTMAAVIKARHIKLMVIGYSSDVQNALQLSVDRAQHVKDYLANEGVNADDLKIKGGGATNFIAPDNTETGRLLNTRVEFRQR